MNLAAIPAEVRKREQWVLWLYEERDGQPTKIPYTAAGDKARSSARTTWTRFDAVVANGDELEAAGLPLDDRGRWHLLADAQRARRRFTETHDRAQGVRTQATEAVRGTSA